jgi:hypothetical protein
VFVCEKCDHQRAIWYDVRRHMAVCTDCMADGIDGYGHERHFRRLDPATEDQLRRDEWEARDEAWGYWE